MKRLVQQESLLVLVTYALRSTGLVVLATIWIPRRGLRLAILAWAGLWLLLVAVVKLTAL